MVCIYLSPTCFNIPTFVGTIPSFIVSVFMVSPRAYSAYVPIATDTFSILQFISVTLYIFIHSFDISINISGLNTKLAACCFKFLVETGFFTKESQEKLILSDALLIEK